MKTLLFVSLFLLSANVFAARELKAIMSDMGDNFEAIAKPLSQNRMEASMPQVSDRLVLLVEEADTVLPDTIDTFDNQARAIAHYHQLMGRLLVAVKKLSQALHDGNLKTAMSALSEAGAVKQAGHEEFKL